MKIECKLCGQLFDENEMSEEHYPAQSVGNNDMVALDLTKMFDVLLSENYSSMINQRLQNGETLQSISDDLFDHEITKPLYPQGRTALTLCRDCNTFLGNYDAAYLKFYNNDGNPNIVKGYTQKTKYRIIKAILGKFLSLPETRDEEFDFIQFVRDDSSELYEGEWHLYFVKRDSSTDLMNLRSYDTGKLIYDEGVVYELCDEKFIFDLMNFTKHSEYDMSNMFDILNKNYRLVSGVGENGGYHGMIMLEKVFNQNS